MITINKLKKNFGELEVLRDITTTINRGDVISIIGPSGTGKSTLLRCMNLLDPPTSGEIIVGDCNILAKGANVAALRRKMGMVFQSFNLFDHLTVMENATIGQIKLLGRTKEAAEQRGMELLRSVGLGEKANAYPDQLSGGQKQRVAIARALSVDPEIILFDEPTSALDPTMVSEVLGVIRKLAQQGMTMAIVTHEMEFARNVSSRIFYMDEGIIYEEGTPEQIFDNPQGEKTRRFIERVKSLVYEIKSRDYDLYEFQAAIYSFCSRNFVEQNHSDQLVLVIEEMLQLISTDDGALFNIDYSDKTKKIICSIEQHSATPQRIFSGGDEDDINISKSIIEGVCESITESVESGLYSVVLTL